jgi:hypothetical protein
MLRELSKSPQFALRFETMAVPSLELTPSRAHPVGNRFQTGASASQGRAQRARTAGRLDGLQQRAKYPRSTSEPTKNIAVGRST